MCFFFRRGRRDGGSALEDAFITDMLITDYDKSGDDESDEDVFDEDEFDEDEFGDDELDEESDEPVEPEISDERAASRRRGRGCEITLSDLIFWETIFGDDD